MKKILYLMFVALLTVTAGTAWGQTNPDRTLGDIPTGWKVQAGSVNFTADENNYEVQIPAGSTVTLTPLYPAKVKSVKLKDVPPTGAIKGEFTVNAGGKKVWFSQGNLQAVCSSADNDASTQETWTWRFAANQWEYIGSAAANNSINGNGSVSTAGTVDLFGWVGTSSSYDNYGIHNNTTASDYGNTSNESLKHDWGHNAIANGGNSADMWRTLTRDEWGYMLNMRSGATVNGTDNVRFAKATIRTDETAVKGVILFPDGATFEASEASWNDLNYGYNNYTTTCTAAQWTALEAKGCVFLPAASVRTGTTVSNESSIGAYWTATGSNQSGYYTWAHMVYFNTNTWSTSSSYKEKSYGLSVRLVKVVPHAVDLSTLTGDYEAQDGDILINTLAGNYKITIADGATVTLRNATINGTNDNSYQWAGITCLGDATIILSGTNTVKGFNVDYPGIQAAHNTGSGDEYTLTIQGTGSLTASSNGFGAGIGGGYDLSCGNIEIQGGTITATGGDGCAGIGAGNAVYNVASCGNITISGGNITANGGESGAGIGTGFNGTCGNITISGGSITANGGSDAAGIGTGFNGNCGSITISGGSITAKGGGSGAGIGTGYNGTCGNITISGGSITANGGGSGAGIGTGAGGTCGTITIYNIVTSVTATKGSSAPNSIGAGGDGSCGTVKFGDETMYNGSSWTTTPTDGGIYDGLRLAITTTTNTNDTWTLTPYVAPAAPTGAIDGLFSVSSTKQVYFSQGNLQYQASTGTWRFAEHQYDFIGNDNIYASETNPGWIDLYRWGTSGIDYTGHATKYLPWETSFNSADFNPYGSLTTNLYDGDGENAGKADWGYNAISNGGNTQNSGWRTLKNNTTDNEWQYIFNSRTTANVINSTSNARYTQACINTDGTLVKGIILFPDGSIGDTPSGVTWGAVNAASDWNTGTQCTTAGWAALEAAGCVFLPASGKGEPSGVSMVETEGYYWSSSCAEKYWSTEYAYGMYFYNNNVRPQYSDTRYYGCSVRLVKDAN